MNTYYSNGKLLLTGEYVVLDGAKALALPTQYGQSLSIQKINELKLIWESYTSQGELWLQVEFDLPRLRIINATFNSAIEGPNEFLAEKLRKILLQAQELNPTFLKNNQGYYTKNNLSFPRNWGLGSSSTLVNNIAQWATIDAFDLQFGAFGGSGYDVACAQHNFPIEYQLKNHKPSFERVDFDPSFKNQLFFVHLNKKQNSRTGILDYHKNKENVSTYVDEISSLTQQTIDCSTLSNFEILIAKHEAIISKLTKQQPIQKKLFADYFGQTKSLGAWGGDFILATGNDDTPNYFKSKGFKTVIPYSDMILCNKE